MYASVYLTYGSICLSLAPKTKKISKPTPQSLNPSIPQSLNLYWSSEACPAPLSLSVLTHSQREGAMTGILVLALPSFASEHSSRGLYKKP